MGYMVLDTMHIQGILSEGIEGAMNLENLVLREFGQNPMKDGRTMTSYIGQNAQMCGRSIGVVMAHLHYRTIVETEGKVCTGTKVYGQDHCISSIVPLARVRLRRISIKGYKIDRD